MKKNFRILFVDDEQPVLNGIRRIFQARRSDWELIFATSGREGLQKASIMEFDLIVTDGKMPGMSGSEMLKEMKSKGLTKDVPTIMLTGYVDDDMRKEALECGIIEFVNKPVIPDEFVLRIENVLNFKMMHDELKSSTDELTAANEELSKLYEVISEQKAELEELNEVKSQFIEIAMNDFRNSTQKIADLTADLSDMMDPDSEKEKLDKAAAIYKCAEELAGIYTKIMNVADVTSGNLKLKYSKVNTLNFFSELTAQAISSAEKKEIKVVSRHDNILPVENFMDENKIWIALDRIIENAVKYSESSTTIELYLGYKDNQLVFTVKDFGIGILKDDLIDIFKFSSGEEEEVNKQGVSLPIVKKIVEAHNGEITAESKFGGGSTFKISLPLLEELPENN
ncbi:MAG: hybrid sensor histidine kinase/response regulator [Candidatus Delongbacteria bacterium]|nr:hybrid sensor histidine kinase/response regulator [Candidatus Delongbacteria bacterium]